MDSSVAKLAEFDDEEDDGLAVGGPGLTLSSQRSKVLGSIGSSCVGVEEAVSLSSAKVGIVVSILLNSKSESLLVW